MMGLKAQLSIGKLNYKGTTSEKQKVPVKNMISVLKSVITWIMIKNKNSENHTVLRLLVSS